jgi:acetyltransferase-like isoleucine patch superfamily enzyme
MQDFDDMMNPPPWQREYKTHTTRPAKKGTGGVIHDPVWIGSSVTIGDDVKIQAFAFIPNGVTIGNNVFVGPHVCFTNDKNPPHNDFQETVVEDDVRIGANVTVLPGITLGKGCMIGAGAVVTKSVPAGETWVGNPAKKHGN